MADRPATPRTTALARSGKTRLTRQLVSRQHTSGDDVWQVLVDANHRAVLVHDAGGVVQVVSASATELFPGLVPGAQLADVPDFDAGSEPFEVVRAGVRWRWHAERLDAQQGRLGLAGHPELGDRGRPERADRRIAARALSISRSERLPTDALSPPYSSC